MATPIIINHVFENQTNALKDQAVSSTSNLDLLKLFSLAAAKLPEKSIEFEKLKDELEAPPAVLIAAVLAIHSREVNLPSQSSMHISAQLPVSDITGEGSTLQNARSTAMQPDNITNITNGGETFTQYTTLRTTTLGFRQRLEQRSVAAVSTATKPVQKFISLIDNLSTSVQTLAKNVTASLQQTQPQAADMPATVSTSEVHSTTGLVILAAATSPTVGWASVPTTVAAPTTVDTPKHSNPNEVAAHNIDQPRGAQAPTLPATPAADAAVLTSAIAHHTVQASAMHSPHAAPVSPAPAAVITPTSSEPHFVGWAPVPTIVAASTMVDTAKHLTSNEIAGHSIAQPRSAQVSTPPAVTAMTPATKVATPVATPDLHSSPVLTTPAAVITPTSEPHFVGWAPVPTIVAASTMVDTAKHLTSNEIAGHSIAQPRSAQVSTPPAVTAMTPATKVATPVATPDLHSSPVLATPAAVITPTSEPHSVGWAPVPTIVAASTMIDTAKHLTSNEIAGHSIAQPRSAQVSTPPAVTAMTPATKVATPDLHSSPVLTTPAAVITPASEPHSVGQAPVPTIVAASTMVDTAKHLTSNEIAGHSITQPRSAQVSTPPAVTAMTPATKVATPVATPDLHSSPVLATPAAVITPTSEPHSVGQASVPTIVAASTMVDTPKHSNPNEVAAHNIDQPRGAQVPTLPATPAAELASAVTDVNSLFPLSRVRERVGERVIATLQTLPKSDHPLPHPSPTGGRGEQSRPYQFESHSDAPKHLTSNAIAGHSIARPQSAQMSTPPAVTTMMPATKVTTPVATPAATPDLHSSPVLTTPAAALTKPIAHHVVPASDIHSSYAAQVSPAIERVPTQNTVAPVAQHHEAGSVSAEFHEPAEKQSTFVQSPLINLNDSAKIDYAISQGKSIPVTQQLTEEVRTPDATLGVSSTNSIEKLTQQLQLMSQVLSETKDLMQSVPVTPETESHSKNQEATAPVSTLLMDTPLELSAGMQQTPSTPPDSNDSPTTTSRPLNQQLQQHANVLAIRNIKIEPPAPTRFHFNWGDDKSVAISRSSDGVFHLTPSDEKVKHRLEQYGKTHPAPSEGPGELPWIIDAAESATDQQRQSKKQAYQNEATEE